VGKSTAPRRVRIEPGIYRRPDGALEIGWRDAQGKQRWRKVQGRLKAARAALAEEHARRGRGERIASDPRLTFDRAADAWWEARALKLRDTTQEAYAAALRHLRGCFGKRRMTDITATDVARYVTAKQGEGLKGWTVKGHMTVLSSVFTYAARHMGLTAQNPITLLDRVERPSSDDEKPKRILNADELSSLLGAADDAYSTLFDLAAETGARLAEALGLAWENIDLDEQTVAFTHQLSRARRGRPARRVPLKTRRSRRVLEVTPGLISKLRAHKIASARSKPHDLVFCGRDGKGFDHRNIGGRVLARAVRRAGLGAVKDASGEVVTPAPTFHALRHSHASALIAQGWDIEEVSARLGHADVATTQRTYVHQFDAARRSPERRARLAKLYGAGVEKTEDSEGEQTEVANPAEVLPLRAKRGASA
jgi:integrase